jgi:hypothetical protein
VRKKKKTARKSVAHKDRVRRQKLSPRRTIVVNGKKIVTYTPKGGKLWLRRKDGRKYLRCQARKTDGTQCSRHAAAGRAVCTAHGGGGKTGRPPSHGLYSKKVQEDFKKAWEKMKDMPFDAKVGLKYFAVFSALTLQKIANYSEYPEGYTRLVEVGSSATERYMKAQGMIPASLLPALFRMMMGVVQKCFKNPEEIGGDQDVPPGDGELTGARAGRTRQEDGRARLPGQKVGATGMRGSVLVLTYLHSPLCQLWSVTTASTVPLIPVAGVA